MDMNSPPIWGSDSPFSDLSISSHRVLLDAPREKCPKCSTYCKYYCYACFSLMPSISSKDIPKVFAPKEILIWKHPNESIAKCTSVHALLLFGSTIQLFQHHPIFDDATNLGQYLINPDETILLYPTMGAPFIGNVDICSYKCVFFLESSWKQSATMLNVLTSNFPKLRIAQLNPTTTFLKQGTLFWRYQNRGEFCLSTIEAIYLLCKQINPSANYDNSLYFFSFFYHLIQEHYSKGGRTFSTKHRFGKLYIKSNDN